MHAAREIRRGSACSDAVGVAAVGHNGPAGGGNPGPREQRPVFVNEPDNLEEASLARGFGRDANPYVARQIAVFGESVGIGRAYENRMAEFDVPGRERNRQHPRCIHRALLQDCDAASHEVVLGGGRKQPDPGPDVDTPAAEGQPGAVHGFEGVQQIGLVAEVLVEGFGAWIRARAVADRLKMSEEAVLQNAPRVRATGPHRVCCRGRGRARRRNGRRWRVRATVAADGCGNEANCGKTPETRPAPRASTDHHFISPFPDSGSTARTPSKTRLTVRRIPGRPRPNERSS